MTKETQLADLTVKRTRDVTLMRTLIAIAVIAVCMTVGLVFHAVTADREGWRQVAVDQKRQIDEQQAELSCRSDAAKDESAALGELTIQIGVTAEAALRIAANEAPQTNIVEIANALNVAAENLRAASRARDLASTTCSTPPTTVPGD